MIEIFEDKLLPTCLGFGNRECIILGAMRGLSGVVVKVENYSRDPLFITPHIET